MTYLKEAEDILVIFSIFSITSMFLRDSREVVRSESPPPKVKKIVSVRQCSVLANFKLLASNGILSFSVTFLVGQVENKLHEVSIDTYIKN